MQQETHFLGAAMLQYDVEVVSDPQITPLPGVASLFCDITAVVEMRLSRHCIETCLSFQQIYHNIFSHRGGPGLRRVWQVGFVVDKVASGQVFSEYFSFPCQNRSFH
jgi:hypothetical protein